MLGKEEVTMPKFTIEMFKTLTQEQVREWWVLKQIALRSMGQQYDRVLYRNRTPSDMAIAAVVA